jgi:hypothetical protein
MKLGLVHVLPDGATEVLTNFIARIVKQIVQDDGATQQRLYEIEAHIPAINRLSETDEVEIRDRKTIIVPADKFEGMGWVHTQLGSAYQILPPGAKQREATAKAIQTTSYMGHVVLEEITYKHLGWRFIDNAWVYLHGGGALGNKYVQTDLRSEKLDRYRLPQVDDDECRSAFQHSLTLLTLGPPRIMYPLVACVYRAPLCHFLPCSVMLHLSGDSGSFKSR